MTERHCSYCLISLQLNKQKLCSGCNKRVYCSRECQKIDWKLAGNGQSHSFWCKLKVGEEDLDWKVVEIPGKGLGVVALRNFEAGDRIIVEHAYTNAEQHSAVQDLLPLGGSLKQKFDLNCLGAGDNVEIQSVLSLRISRINHSCDRNASHYYDQIREVKILFSERQIHAGDEILIDYTPYVQIKNTDRLQSVYNIICPVDCLCKSAQMMADWTLAESLDDEILRKGMRRDSIGSLHAVTQLVALNEKIGASLLDKIRVNYDGFQMSIMRKRTMKGSKAYLAKALEYESKISSPESESALNFKKFLDNPQLHRNYLILER